MQFTSHNELVNWLSSLKAGFQAGELSSPEFLKPYHLATIGLMMKKEGKQLMGLPKHLQDYAVRMQLWDAVEIDPPSFNIYNNTPGKNFIPANALNDKNLSFSLAKKLSEMLNKNKGKSDISIMLSEIMNNTFDHAEVTDDLHGLVCAQSWPKGNLTQTIIADLGIGIQASIKQNPKLAESLQENVNICKYACEYGITSKSEGHAGYGLALAKQLMLNHGGNLSVVSYNEIFTSNYGCLTSGSPYWEGTLIMLEWPTNSALDTKVVYDNWPCADDFNTDDLYL